MRYQKIDWVHHTNVYEVNLRQYTKEGTFNAFVAHMNRLKEMGVHTLWFMPITPISQYKRKGLLGSYYASQDYTATNPEFGSLEEFRDLVRLAHDMDMKVIIDWVANHTGADHKWTFEHPEFYHKNEQGDFYDKNGWDDVIDLNYGNEKMRAEMIDCMKFWVQECDIDGFRCDMAMLTPVDFWHQARAAVDQLKPLFWMAECDQWSDPAYLEVFDAAYTWKWMHVTQEHYQNHKHMIVLKDILYRYNDLEPRDALRLWFTSNHDENSWNGTEYEKYGHMAQALAVFSCTWNGIPLIYTGQELPNHKRLAFFEKDEIHWGILQMEGFYKKLLWLQRTHPALACGTNDVQTFFVFTDHEDKMLVYLRKNGDSEVMVMMNLSPYMLNVTLYDDRVWGRFNELFSDLDVDLSSNRSLHVEPWGYRVFVK
ncbi:MAG: alpha-amylase family glycosyl hydrolase [Chitinophagaceae bacterium]